MKRILALCYTGAAGAEHRGLDARIAQAGKVVEQRWASISARERVLGLAVIGAAGLAAVGAGVGARAMAYLSVFVGSAVASAILFLPSSRWAILIGGALVLNPWAVAVLSGIGGAVGELSGYFLGRSSSKIVRQDRACRWFARYANRWMGITVLLIAAVPNPFVDVLALIAGRAGYPVGKYVAFTAVGKVLQCLAVVLVVAWNLSFFSRWIATG